MPGRVAAPTQPDLVDGPPRPSSSRPNCARQGDTGARPGRFVCTSRRPGWVEGWWADTRRAARMGADPGRQSECRDTGWRCQLGWQGRLRGRIRVAGKRPGVSLPPACGASAVPWGIEGERDSESLGRCRAGRRRKRVARVGQGRVGRMNRCWVKNPGNSLPRAPPLRCHGALRSGGTGGEGGYTGNRDG